MNNNPDTNQDWDAFLSSAAQLSDTDQQSTDAVLSALRLERQRATDPIWSQYLSSAAQLRPVDMAAISPTIKAVRTERQKNKILRLHWTRAIAGLAAAAVATLAFVILIPTTNADPTEAYTAYQEATIGW